MSSKADEESLVRRGAPLCAIPPQQLKVVQNACRQQSKEQCDSGFGEGSESFKNEDDDVRSIEESTKNITIEDPNDKAEERQPISSPAEDDTNMKSVPPIGGHLLDFARCSDVRYLLAPQRELLFVGDEDGDT